MQKKAKLELRLPKNRATTTAKNYNRNYRHNSNNKLKTAAKKRKPI